MKLSFAAITSAVLATQTTEYVSVSSIFFMNQPSCLEYGTVKVGSGFNAVGPALDEAFKKFGLPAEVTVKHLPEEVRGRVRVQHLDISVKIKNVLGWTDSPEITMARSKALLNIAGTLNLYYPSPSRPWIAKITIDTDGTAHEFIPSSTYSRPSQFIKDAESFALIKTGCRVVFPK
jgi:hypothetical protein